MQKKRIAFIIDNFSIRAGFIKQVVETANYYSKLHYEVTVFCSKFDAKNCFPEIEKKFNIQSIEYKNIYIKLLAIENRTLKKFAMQKLILKQNKDFDIFVIHGDPYFMLSQFITHTFKKAKLIWHTNDLPYSYDVLARNDVSFVNRMTAYVFRIIDKYYVSQFNNITTLNDSNKKLILKYFNKNSTVVYTGVDDFFIQVKKNAIRKKTNISILTVGAFAMNRRYEDIIHAIKLLNQHTKNKKFYLKIVGYQNSAQIYANTLKSLVSNLDLTEYVSFVNSVTNVALKQEYMNADIFVQSTEYIGWTIPAMEAMVSDVPTIITDSCGLNECLQDGEEVLIIKPRSPKAIKEKIRMLVDDQELYERLRRNGKKIIMQKFMWESYCKRYLNFTDNIKN